MNKIRKGDEVIVLAGKDKGKRGTVLSISATYAPVGSAYVVPSAIAKAGVEALTRFPCEPFRPDLVFGEAALLDR